MRENIKPGGESLAARVWNEYEGGVAFKQQLNLYDTVKVNEDFYVGRQWEGVQANGLPTPVFNYIKRIILYLVASTATDNLKMNAAPLAAAGTSEALCRVVNAQFEALFEQNKMSSLIRRFMRNAAVDGDACLYAWFDPDAENGTENRGAIRTEILENTRVIFGNPNEQGVQEQPWLILSRRERVEDVRREMSRYGGDPESVRADGDDANDRFDAMDQGKVTTVLKFWRDGSTGTVWAAKCVQGAMIRAPWDTEQKRYPIVWLSWDRVPNCYHGQAAVTGLIPNQIFVNKMFAMTMISLMTTAYPKVVYDKTRITHWDSGVGKAIAVNGGDMASVARTIDPATISPQVSQFIELAISLTKEFMGATDAALGNVRPDNTSAIIALQKASQVPMELTRQDLFQCIEELGLIWLDLMAAYYGVRVIPVETDGEAAWQVVDFEQLGHAALRLKLDVGGSAYWSEIAQMNTLDNLLMQGQIGIVDYLERVPQGYISDQQALIDRLKAQESAPHELVPMGQTDPLV